MKYIYPAIFTKEDDGGYLVEFPDLPECYTDGDSLAEAFENAEDALALMMWNLEEKKAPIATPSNPADITPPAGAIVSLVKADTLPVRKMNDTRAIRKNVTIPGWLNTIACENNINFSQLLQNAIIRECGLKA